MVFGLLPGWGLSAVDHLRRLFVLITALFCFGAVLMFFTKSTENISRLSIGVTWLFTLVFIPLGRTISRHVLCKRGLHGLPTIVFGRAEIVAEIAGRLREDSALGYMPVGVCTNDPVSFVAGLPVVGSFDDVSPHGPAAIVASNGLDVETNRLLINRVLTCYRNVMVMPDLGDVPSLFISPRDLSGNVGLEISQTLLSPYASKFKRALDLAAVVVTAPLWMPLCAAIYAAIWLEDGRHPLFRQARAGRNEETFYALKCRTMVVNAEAVLKRHLDSDPELRREWETSFKLRVDPRITRVGSFLRKTSLDELPQLFNVLRGEMALVGPRPLPAYHLEQLGPAVRSLRSNMRPGLTGLWQVSGRSDIGSEGMKRWDHYYVRNWSMWLDIVILVRTLRVVVMGSGAR